MKLILSLLLIMVAMVTHSVELEQLEETVSNKSEFDMQRELVLARSEKSDFKKLRLSYTDTDQYKPYSRLPTKPMFGTMKEDKFEECIELAEKNVESVFVHIYSHFSLYVCNKELGNMAESAFHKFVLDGLMKSIYASGDGKSPETAYTVISADEVYSYLRLIGLTVKGQGLVHANGRVYDQMNVVRTEGDEKFPVFFDITLQMSKGMSFLDKNK